MYKYILILALVLGSLGCSTISNNSFSNINKSITSGELREVVASAQLSTEQISAIDSALNAYTSIKSKYITEAFKGKYIVELFKDTTEIREDYDVLLNHYMEVYGIVMLNIDKYSKEDREYLQHTSAEFHKTNTMLQKALALDDTKIAVVSLVKAAYIAADMIRK